MEGWGNKIGEWVSKIEGWPPPFPALAKILVYIISKLVITIDHFMNKSIGSCTRIYHKFIKYT